MTADFQSIDGVGPSRAENLEEEGYEEFSDLADAKPEVLAESLPRCPEDTALEMVVQAQNLADLEEAEVESSSEEPEPEPKTEDEEVSVQSTYTEGRSEGPDETASEESEDVSEPEDPTHSVELEIASEAQYDALYDMLLGHRKHLLGTNQSGVEEVNAHIDQLRTTAVGDTLDFEMAEDEINAMHNVIKQQRVNYQANNLQPQLGAARELESEFNNERQRLLF